MLWYILPALLRAQDGRVKRHERFASVVRCDIALFAPVADGIHPPGIGEA